jgi:phage protein D/phage baseplate assembly protein gpV
MVRAVVDDSLHRPDAFEIELRDPDRGLVARLGLKIGAALKVGVVGDVYPAPENLIEGEVTALDAEFDEHTNVTIIRGYDHSHRLFRGRTTTSYQNVTSSDVAQRVAKRAGLKTGTIDSTKQVHDHVGQKNQNDWDFLSGLAGQVGFEVAVSEGKLHFRKPNDAKSGPSGMTLSQEDPLQLLLGSTLLRLRSSITSSGQVPEVQARGWDPGAKKAVVGTAKIETVSAHVAVRPADLAARFTAPPLVAARVPLTTGAEVDALAKAVAEEVASSFAELEGVARGNPKLKAGVAVHLGLVGDPFDGKYVLSNTRHVYDRYEGYTTAFTVSGRGERSFLALTEPGASSQIEGVVVALVDDVADKEGQLRVRLRFPWLSEDYVSDWSRIVQIGAGPGRGMIWSPEVGDEVLVAFDRGDLRRPYVVGGLYNGKDHPDLGPYSHLDGGKRSVDTRRFVSRKGHSITFSDSDGKEKVVVSSKDGTMLVELDIANNVVKIASGGKVEVSARTDASIEATGTLTLKGNMVSIQAQASLEAKASGNVSVKGALIQLN